MAESQITPWPLHETSITRFASILKVCKYRGANCYLTAISSTNKLMSHQLDFKAAYAMRMARIACDRDLGDDFSVDPITLSQLRDVGKLTSSRFRLLVGRLAVIGIYYCLRPRELLNLRGLCQCHSTSCSCSAAVRLRCGELQITLYGDKTHQKNEKIVRSLVCCCGGSTAKWPIPICPVCAFKAIISSSSVRSPKTFWLSQGKLKKPLKYQGFHDELVLMMASLGRVTKVNGRCLYGGQSLRRSGAQALAASGWCLALIRLWGRWAPDSQVVNRYVRNAALLAKDVDAARSIFIVSGAADGVDTTRI
jgi:hypothetical protein